MKCRSVGNIAIYNTQGQRIVGVADVKCRSVGNIAIYNTQGQRIVGVADVKCRSVETLQYIIRSDRELSEWQT